MPDVKYRDQKSQSQRIQDRLRPSSTVQARRPQDFLDGDQTVIGTGPTRVVHTVHKGGSTTKSGHGQKGDK
jgi:hypothetical protein